MNPNEAYMIPGFLTLDLPRKAEQQNPNPQPKLYKKCWGAVICKDEHPEVVKEPNDEILSLKIRTEKELLKGSFKMASSRLQEDLLLQTREQAEAVGKMLIQQHLDNLWLKNARSYVRLSLFEFTEALYGFTDTKKAKGIQENTLGEMFSSLVLDTINVYYKQRENLEQNLLELLQSIRSGKGWGTKITKRFLSAEAALENVSHRRKISATLTKITLSGQDKYAFVCTEEDDTCEACSALDGQVFDVDKAVEGVNLPPMHPNCRCSIAGYPETSSRVVPQELLVFLLEQAAKPAIERILGKLDDKLTRFFDELGVVWSALFEESALGTYNSFETVMVGGKQYRINREGFQAVAIGPDEKYIVPENVSPENDKLLKIMQQRDSYPAGSSEYVRLHAEATAIFEALPAEEQKVNPNNTYAYYILGGDITRQLNEYMMQTEITYPHMKEKTWIENIPEFYRIVNDYGIMDLKRQPEWQHSAFIYDGEIISYDDPGNINFGYFGRFCNFPKSVLLLGAGVKQILDKTSDWSFVLTFFDDPRDAYRILQGIDIYNALRY